MIAAARSQDGVAQNPAYRLARYFSTVCRTEGHGLLLMRTRPGSTTVKASRSREPDLDTASITVADLARRARLGKLTRITPAEERPRAETNSPETPSSLMSNNVLTRL